MLLPCGIDDDNLYIGIGLCSNRSYSIPQGGAVHTANNDADQRQLLRLGSKPHGITLQRPAAKTGTHITLE